MEEVFSTLVAITLIILPIASWTATYILRKIYKKSQPYQIAIKERYMVAIILALVTTINAELAINRLTGNQANNTVMLALLAISLILVSVPNIYWLWLYATNRFRG